MADTLFFRATRKLSKYRLLVCAAWTVVFCFVPLTHLENYLADSFLRAGRMTEANPQLVFIAIDRASYDDVILESEGAADPVLGALRKRFPWPRKVWAAAIERLAQAGAKTIVLDLLLQGPDDDDPLLQAALDRFGERTVLGNQIFVEETDRGEQRGLIEAPFKGDAGFINIWPDEDQKIRYARFRVSNRELGDALTAGAETVIASIDAIALAKFDPSARVPSDTGFHRIRFTGPPGEWKPIPIGDVLTPKLWTNNFENGAFFKDKLVLIGPAAQTMQDLHETPFRRLMKGPEVHLNMINATLRGQFIGELPPWGRPLLILAAGLITAILSELVAQSIRRFFILLSLAGAYLLGTYWLFDHANLLLIPAAPALTMIAGGLSFVGYDFILERLERLKLRHTMALYFSPSVLNAVLDDPGSMTPRSAEVSMLLTDLRNSTPLAELLGPEGMFALLNKVFAVQTQAIMSEKGNLEHFLGDQFLSYWGAPKEDPAAADRSLEAARKLIAAMELLKNELPEGAANLFGYGVALHSGRVLVGNKGSAQRMDYGLVGDALNEAARIEALTKYYGVRLLVSRQTFAQLKDQGVRRLLDRIVVKGKSESVDLFECENPCTPRNFRELCQRYKAAFDQYSFGRFEAARELFEALAGEFDDGPSRILAQRCAQLAASPPANWEGVWKMQSK